MFEEFIGPAPGWAESSWLGPLGIALAIASITFSFLLWFFTPPAVRLQRRVDSLHRDDRKWLIETLGGVTPYEGYIAAISTFNMKLNGWFGARWSGHAFSRCLQLAYIYPIALSFLSIAIGADSSGLWASLAFIGGAPVIIYIAGFLPYLSRLQKYAALRTLHFPPIITVTMRIVGVLTPFVGAFVGTVAVSGASVTIADTHISLFITFGWIAGVPVCGIGYVVAEALTRVFAGYPFFILVVIYAIMNIVALAFAFLFSFSFSYSIAFPVSFAGSVAFICIAMLLLLIPLFNAALDWLSWGVTRYFLEKAEKSTSTTRGIILLFMELLADFLIAALLLVSLAVLLVMGSELMTQLVNPFANSRVPWESVLSAFQAKPWGTGLIVTGMLITTLIPTFLHLVAGVAGVFFAWSPNAKAIAHKISYDPASEDNQPVMSEIDKELIVRKLRQMRWWTVPACVLVVLIFAGFYGLFSLTGESFLVFLVDVARCGGALAGNGVCPLL
jgi:hypothetical protein